MKASWSESASKKSDWHDAYRRTKDHTRRRQRAPTPRRSASMPEINKEHNDFLRIKSVITCRKWRAQHLSKSKSKSKIKEHQVLWRIKSTNTFAFKENNTHQNHRVPQPVENTEKRNMLQRQVTDASWKSRALRPESFLRSSLLLNGGRLWRFSPEPRKWRLSQVRRKMTEVSAYINLIEFEEGRSHAC